MTKTTKALLAEKAAKMKNMMVKTTIKTTTNVNAKNTKQIEKLYNEGLGARKIAEKLNLPRRRVMRVIEDLGLFIYAAGSYR